jgi:serine protease AprX
MIRKSAALCSTPSAKGGAVMRDATSVCPWLLALSGIAILLGALAAAAKASDEPACQVRERELGRTQLTLDRLAVDLAGGATRKVWVYFTDKHVFDSEACRARLGEVASALDPHAASRRARSMGADRVDFYDLPVPEIYVQALVENAATVVHRSRWLNAVSVRASLRSLQAIAALPFVQKITLVAAHRDSRLLPSKVTDISCGQRRIDPYDYGPSRDQLAKINVIAAHALGFSGQGVIVAVFDTGFKRTEPAFQQILASGRLLAQYDFINDDGETMNEPGDAYLQHFHGTVTWSVLAGFAPGQLIGPAFGASFLLAKTEDIRSETPVEEDNWVAAAEWADGLGADVISSSLGYSDWYGYPDMDGDTAVITIAADLAASRGIVVCNAAGNMGDQEWHYVVAPADGDSVISVGSVDSANKVAYFSSRGPTFDGRTKPEVVAPGVSIYAAVPDTTVSYGVVSGTSVSCPLVAGVAALLLEAHPTWDPMMVKAALMLTADNASAPNNDRGWGRIDALAALNGPSATTELPAPAAPRLYLTPNPFHASVEIALRSGQGADRPTGLEIVDVAGRSVVAFALPAGGSPFRWDGRDASGRPVATGVYFARIRSGDWRGAARLVRAD